MPSTPTSAGLTICLALCLAISCQAQPPTATVRALKHENMVYVRTSFSASEDLVVRVGKGTNGQFNFLNTYLIPVAAPMTETALIAGRLIHGNGDDSTPWNFNGTYIGGNHGCSAGRELTVANHGLTAADLGSIWTDEAGTRFTLLKIVDANRLWFLSDNLSQDSVWRFNTTVKGTSLKRVDKDATLAFTDNRMAQLTPSCRMEVQQVMVDGKTALQDDTPVSCAWLDLVEEYEIIDPAGLLKDFQDHPGMERSFVAEHLPAVVSNHITYRFYPNGADVVTTRARVLKDLNIGYMGFIQSAKLATGAYTSHEYYIPKTLPWEQDGKTYNFRMLQDYTAPPATPIYFNAAKKNVEDPQNLPERYIQLLGKKEGAEVKREVGFALGYSLLHGMTVPAQRAALVNNAAFLYTSAKSYPSALDSKGGPRIPADTAYTCVAYRQYFNAAAQPQATCFYWHRENDDVVVYADYHHAVDRDVLPLPAELVGKAIRVVEKTPSVTVHDTTVPAAGVAISVTGDYGSVVLAVQ